MNRIIKLLAIIMASIDVCAQDYTGTYQVVQAMLAETKPACAFRADMTAAEMPAWQQRVSQAMNDLMCHPQMPEHINATMISSERLDGYTRQIWQFVPLPHCNVKFTVLLPDNGQFAISSEHQNNIPAVLCIPGSGMTMANVCDTLDQAYCFATRIVREGYVAVAVENACAGTQQDEGLTSGAFDYDTPSRFLLELGWSWLGYTSYIDRQILQWMKQQSFIRRDRICIAGFSLGTEPLMVLGALDPEIYAFAYNDFLCNTQERALSMSETEDATYKYSRPFPNSIRHLIPRWWRYFNFPDIVASLAPRHLILTEGGMDRDFNLIRRAYELSGHPENLELYHYAKFADPKMREPLDEMPRGITRDTFFRLANVDTRSHYFKAEHIIPWLNRIMFKQ